MTEPEIPETYGELLLLVRPSVITGQREYKRQLKWVDRIMKAEVSNSDCEPRIHMANLLAATIMVWESKTQATPAVPARKMVEKSMKSRDLSQVAFAEQIGVSPQLVSAIIRGERVITLPMARRLGAFFNLPVSNYIDLVGLEA